MYLCCLWTRTVQTEQMTGSNVFMGEVNSITQLVPHATCKLVVPFVLDMDRLQCHQQATQMT